jgi:hypothetical protein
MQRTTIVKAALLGLAALGISVAANAQIRSGSETIPAQRSYLCFGASSPAEVTNQANEAGARGWKMVASAAGPHESIWCFEQLQAARPHPER